MSQADSENSLGNKAQPHHASLVNNHSRRLPSVQSKDNVQSNKSLSDKHVEHKTAQNLGQQKMGPAINQVFLQEGDSEYQSGQSNKNSQGQRVRTEEDKTRRQIMHGQAGRVGSEHDEENFEEDSATQIQKMPTVEYEQMSHNPLRQDSSNFSEEKRGKVGIFGAGLAASQEFKRGLTYPNSNSKLGTDANPGRGENGTRNQNEEPLQLNFERGLEEIRRTVYTNSEKASQVLKINETVTQQLFYLSFIVTKDR